MAGRAVRAVIVRTVVVGHVDDDVHLLVREVVLVLQQRTVRATGLVDAVVDTLVTNTLATAVVEPPGDKNMLKKPKCQLVLTFEF